MYPYIGLDGDYAMYKAFVDTNDTCNASSHLFKRLIDTKYEPEDGDISFQILDIKQ